MNETKSIKSPRVRNLIAFSSLIMLLFCVLVAYQASKAYETSIRDGKINSDRLTRILSDHVELTFLSVDLTLRRAAERQYFNELFGNTLPDYMQHNFQMWVDETPQISAMSMINTNGQSVVSTNKAGYDQWQEYASSSFDTIGFFNTMKNEEDTYFLITKINTAGSMPTDLILMARKLSKLDGSFGGIVIAAINPDYIANFFNSVEAGTHRYMTIMLPDGTALLEGPVVEHGSQAINDDIITDFTRKKDVSIVKTGMKTVNDNIKIYSYKALRNLPLLVAITMDEEDFLLDWRQARIKDIGFLAIFVVFGGVLSFFALTMAKQIQRVEESESAAVLASQAKSEFLANMSHELRTPLNAIIGFSEMMNSGYFGPLNPKQKERIHDINLCGSHLLQLITDILEFSKGDAGKLELAEERVHMEELINETMRMMTEKISTKKLHIIVDVEDGLPDMWGDKRKIRQILINLLTNSIKFTPEEGTIKASAKRDPSGALNLTVSDTGIGIAEDDIAKALSVFGQVHRSQSHEGTGLGLPLCKMFAELHGGKLAIGSTVGEGTTVRVIFPASRLLPEETLELGHETPASPDPKKKAEDISG